MAITTLDQLIAAPRQNVAYTKTATRTTVANVGFSVFNTAGNPGAGTLDVGNTTTGIVPTDSLAGYPVIRPFGPGNTGYLAGISYASTVTSRLILVDCLFSAGAFPFNANVTLSGQPSYASRLPGGTDYSCTEIWIEAVTAFTGNQSIAVTYTNQDGVAGRTTGTIATGTAPIVGRMLELPLQAGDSGVQSIQSVVSTVSTAGTFNIHVMRRLWMGRVSVANWSESHDFMRMGMPQIFENSALRVIVVADSTSSGLPDIMLTVANG